ncbi:MAG: mip-C [Parachlamydiales bacterium]|nr:mip-C [Parachlamydiales bacterium]
MRKTLFAILFIFLAPLFGEEEKKPDIAQLSEAMGHLIGKNLQSMGLPIDMDSLVKGMKDSSTGSGNALSEEECIQALAELQEETRQIQAEKNLAEANEFLKNNLKKKGIVSLENGKVQYQIVQAGSGNAVQPYNSPLMRFKGRYLNGETFGSSSGEELVSLDDAIAGFNKGIIGMHEGEKRTLYIHPDLAYGPHGLSMPNALIIFEVELVKADASADAQAASNAEDEVIRTGDAIR